MRRTRKQTRAAQFHAPRKSILTKNFLRTESLRIPTGSVARMRARSAS
jgi:hypothetical protein